jgi:hypothetical protein
MKTGANYQEEFLGDPAYRTFSGACSWNPHLVTPHVILVFNVINLSN